MFCALPVVVVLLTAGEPSWKNKPIPNWTGEDAKQVLSDSPWAKIVAGVTRRQTEDERKDSGYMGQEHGVGFDGVERTERK